MTKKRSISAIQKDIEHLDYNFLVNQAAGYDMFKKLVRNSDLYQELIVTIKDSDSHHRYLQDSIVRLLSKTNDEQFEHTYDIPIATYLLAIHDTDKSFESISSEVSSANNLWWAIKVMREILGKGT